MKKIALPILFSLLVSITFGQTIKKATSYLDKNDLAKAKTEIDGFLEKKPGDSEGNYIKSKIYLKIADSAAISNLIQGDGRGQALEAFKIAVADSNNVKLKLQIMKDNYAPVFNMYAGYYQEAADAFNEAAGAQSKEGFAKSMNLFKKANEVGAYISKNEWAAIGKVDTTLVLNIGKAALNAGLEDEAKRAFISLADAGISGVSNSEDNDSYRIPYQWLTFHYKDADDEANMVKYANLGKKYFPKDDYFDYVMMDFYRQKKNMPEVFAKHESIIKIHPDSLNYHFNYANDIFGYLYNSDDDVVVQNKDQYLNTLKQELDKAYEINSNDINTNWLYSQYHYNKGIELRDEALAIKGNKPEDVKKKADLKEAAKKSWNEAIPYGKKALKVLEEGKKTSDRSRYKSIANLMQNIYRSLEDRANTKVYEDAYDNADSIFTKD
ncbi:MAG: hypothetical protein ABIN48_10575 [Ginsengibacter sp.]